jgi:hypothetical protein
MSRLDLLIYPSAVTCAALTLAGCGAGRTTRANEAPRPSLSSVSLHPPISTGLTYRADAAAAIASRLHISEANLRSQLRAAPGSTLMNLAKPLGLDQDQLGAVALASLAHAADRAVRSGKWPEAAARKEKDYWKAQPAPSLIAEVSRWLLSG